MESGPNAAKTNAIVSIPQQGKGPLRHFSKSEKQGEISNVRFSSQS